MNGFGKRTHLMLEIKDEPWPDPEGQARRLSEILAPLAPGEDYHLLALDPDLFERAPFVDRRHCIPVSEVNPGAISRRSIELGRFPG